MTYFILCSIGAVCHTSRQFLTTASNSGFGTSTTSIIHDSDYRTRATSTPELRLILSTAFAFFENQLDRYTIVSNQVPNNLIYYCHPRSPLRVCFPTWVNELPNAINLRRPVMQPQRWCLVWHHPRFPLMGPNVVERFVSRRYLMAHKSLLSIPIFSTLTCSAFIPNAHTSAFAQKPSSSSPLLSPTAYTPFFKFNTVAMYSGAVYSSQKWQPSAHDLLATSLVTCPNPHINAWLCDDTRIFVCHKSISWAARHWYLENTQESDYNARFSVSRVDMLNHLQYRWPAVSAHQMNFLNTVGYTHQRKAVLFRVSSRLQVVLHVTIFTPFRHYARTWKGRK